MFRSKWRSIILRHSSNQSKQSDVFVSKHFAVDKNEIRTVLAQLNSPIREVGDRCEVKICNFCNKKSKDAIDNQWKLWVNSSGSYHCFRCSIHGNWFDLKRKISGTTDVEAVPSSYYLETAATPSQPVLLDSKVAYSYAKKLYVDDESSKKVLAYLTDVRCIDKKTLQRYGVGCTTQKFLTNENVWQEETCITFPWMDEIQETLQYENSSKDSVSVDVNEATADEDSLENDEIEEITATSTTIATSVPATNALSVIPSADLKSQPPKFQIIRIKLRSLENKGKQRLLPKGGSWGFFGWHTVKPEDSQIIITEGEFDAMAVAKVISKLKNTSPLYKVPVISLPNGCSSLPVSLIPRLERFDKIYLWMDNDAAGIEGGQKFARKLGTKRVYLVKPLPTDPVEVKDANDAIRNPNCDIVKMILSATTLGHSRLQKFIDYRSEVLGMIRQPNTVYNGTTVQSISKLNSIIKGFRGGELIIFTGPTGSGKTTLLSQLSLDFVASGVPTLWGSFEITNVKLIQKMIQQYHRVENLALLPPDKLEEVADKFEALPMTFMNFHAGSKLEEVIDAMDFALYQYDIRHIILDNLQFMMPRQGRADGKFDRFEAQDQVIDTFRKYCTEKQVNIILVIHPRKEDDRIPLHMSSVFGSAKATQEADVVLILQRIEDKMYLDVRKNRYDGDIGKVNLTFNRMSATFNEAKDDK